MRERERERERERVVSLGQDTKSSCHLLDKDFECLLHVERVKRLMVLIVAIWPFGNMGTT